MSRRPHTAPARSAAAPQTPFFDSGSARNTPPQSRLLRALRRDAQKPAT